MNDDFNRFQLAINTTVGKVCSDVMAGPGNGSIFSLGFGEIVPRSKQNKNFRADGPVNNVAESSLLVHCAWRVSSSTNVIASWRDNNDCDGRMTVALRMLCGAMLINIHCDLVTYDLTLHFDNDLGLIVFCDLPLDDDTSNYQFRIRDMLFIPGVDVLGKHTEWP